jgi:hypothetical protein
VDVPSAWLGVGLVALRWWALLQVQVLWRAAVGRWWIAVSAGLAVVLALGSGGWGAVPTVVPVVDPWLAAVAEVGLGALVGMVVSLPGHAVLGAAGASGRVLGTAAGPWRALTLALVGATALGLGLHRPLLLGAQGALEPWAVGDPLAWGSVDVPVGRLLHGLALLALTLATPALLAGALGEVVLRVAGARAGAGGSMLDATAAWLRVAGAAVATGASWAAYDVIWAARALG